MNDLSSQRPLCLALDGEGIFRDVGAIALNTPGPGACIQPETPVSKGFGGHTQGLTLGWADWGSPPVSWCLPRARVPPSIRHVSPSLACWAFLGWAGAGTRSGQALRISLVSAPPGPGLSRASLPGGGNECLSLAKWLALSKSLRKLRMHVELPGTHKGHPQRPIPHSSAKGLLIREACRARTWPYGKYVDGWLSFEEG